MTSSAPTPLDTANQAQRRASDPRTSAWVGASAGSGKTKVLTDRVLRLLLSGARPGRILCLTFTKAAAAEMANRLAAKLAGWATCAESSLAEQLQTLTGAPPDTEQMAHARRLFAELLDTPGGMKIQTLHSFCQSLLRRFPLEAGIAPHFEVMDERSADEALISARQGVLAAAMAEARAEAEAEAEAGAGTEAEARAEAGAEARAGAGTEAGTADAAGIDRADSRPGLAAALRQVTDIAGEGSFDAAIRLLTRERGRFARLRQRHAPAESDRAAAAADGGTDPRRLASARQASIEGLIAAVYQAMGIAPGCTRPSLLQEACRLESDKKANLQRVAEVLQVSKGKRDKQKAALMFPWLQADEDARAERLQDWLQVFFKDKGQGERFSDSYLASQPSCKALPNCLEILYDEAERLEGIRNRLTAVALAERTGALLRLGAAQLDRFQDSKNATARLDYDDLILRADALLQRQGAASWVLYKLDQGLDHILIDEAQDTNPDQWRIVAALVEEFFAGLGAHDPIDSSGTPTPRTLFVVGDVKQSIYSFQRADPAAFTAMRRYYAKRLGKPGTGPGEEAPDAPFPADETGFAQSPLAQVPLEVSFRSTTAVLALVDAVYAEENAADGVGFGDPIRHQAVRQGEGGRVELWPLVSPDEKAPEDPWAIAPVATDPSEAPAPQEAGPPVQRLAYLIAGTIRDWLDRREILESKGRPILPQDILVLVRRREPFTSTFIQVCKSLHEPIPVAGADRMRLTDHLAVLDLIALGQFLLLPEDDLTLATVLKGPLIGWDDDLLLSLAWGREGSLWRSLWRRRSENTRFGGAAAVLTDWLDKADFTPPYELFCQVLLRHGGRGALLSRLGLEAAEAVEEFLSLALFYERNHAPSLQGFLSWLMAGEAEVKRELDQGERDLVRIMTVHGAKGLQAPIVFLPDTVSLPQKQRMDPLFWTVQEPLTPEERLQALVDRDRPDGATEAVFWSPSRGLDDPLCADLRAKAWNRQMQEYRRLFYVALTRAEDRLYVCGWQGRSEAAENSWYKMAERGMQSLADPERQAGDPVAVPFGLEALEARLSPSLPGPGPWAGTEGWSLVVPQEKPPREQPAPPAPPEDEAAPSRPAAAPLPAWSGTQPPEETRLSRPLSPSRPDEDEPPLRSPAGAAQAARFTRGRLIHRLLQALPSLAPETWEEAALGFLSSRLDPLGAEQAEAMVAEVMAVLKHPDFAPLFGPGSQAEVPIVGTIESQPLPRPETHEAPPRDSSRVDIVSGQIDRLVVTENEVLIVDFKTHRPPPSEPERVSPVYLRQMALYRLLLQQIYSNRNVRCALVWTDGPHLMALPTPLLEQHLPRARILQGSAST